MNNVLPSPRDAKEFFDNPGSTANTFKSTVSTSILTAMGIGKRGATVDLRAVTAGPIREVLFELNQIGYKAQIVGDKRLEIAW